MGDSQQPKKAALTFEVPDLEPAPVRRAASPAPPAQAEQRRVEYGELNLFDEEAFSSGNPTLELGGEQEPPTSADLGPSLDLDFQARGRFELQNDTVASDAPERRSEAHRARRSNEHRVAPGAIDLPGEAGPPISPEEIRLFANYGDAPTSVYLAPAYAYRVFRRKRELRRALDLLRSERTRPNSERDLAEPTSVDEAATRRATELVRRSELHARALDAYDRVRVAQGVRLACTAAAIVMLLILLKFAL